MIEVFNKMGRGLEKKIFLFLLSLLWASSVLCQEEGTLDQTTEDEDIVGLDEAGPSEAEIAKDLQHESEIGDILRNLSSPDEKTRMDAGLLLRKAVRAGDTTVLAQTLKRGNNLDKQLFIIDALTKLGDKKAGEALRFEVRHGEIESQRAATTALGRLQSDWPIPILVRTLRQEKDEDIRKRSASALGMIGSTQAVYAIRTSLSKLEDAPGAKNAAFYALDKALNQIDPQRLDTNMPAGLRLTLYHKGMRYFFYHPTVRKGASAVRSGLRPWLMVCVHDGDLAANDMFSTCWRSAKRRQMAVLVPTFDNITYPEYGNFNIRGERADKKLLELIDFVGNQAGLSVREIYMFGYGTGGDFVHRFIMSNPKRVARAAFEANEFTKPDPEFMFPKGITKTPLAPDVEMDLYSFIKTDMMLISKKDSPTYKDSKIFGEAIQNYADVQGIKSRLLTRNVEAKLDIWNEADKFLFAFDY